MSGTLGWSDIALRLALSVMTGILIGFDRERRAQPAGLRTTVLVCVAATAAMLQAALLLGQTPDNHNSLIRLDLMRLPLGILSGIGFIGGGAILRRGDMVRGVTTAATLWLITVIGLCLGGGQIGLGLAATAIGLATLWLLRLLEEHLHLSQRGRVLIEMRGSSAEPEALLGLLRARGFWLHSRQIMIEPDRRICLNCSGRYRNRQPQWSSELVAELAQHPGIIRVEWRDAD